MTSLRLRQRDRDALGELAIALEQWAIMARRTYLTRGALDDALAWERIAKQDVDEAQRRLAETVRSEP